MILPLRGKQLASKNNGELMAAKILRYIPYFMSLLAIEGH